MFRGLGRCSDWVWTPLSVSRHRLQDQPFLGTTPTPATCPFFPGEPNEGLRLAVSYLHTVIEKCSGVFIKETIGDHIPRVGLLKVLRFQNPEALFVPRWTTGGHPGVGWGDLEPRPLK